MVYWVAIRLFPWKVFWASEVLWAFWSRCVWLRSCSRTYHTYCLEKISLKLFLVLECNGPLLAKNGISIIATSRKYFHLVLLLGDASIEKAMAPHSSTLAWRIPWMKESGGLQSMGSQRDGHDWATSPSLFTFMHWRRKWQPTPVFLPGESQGRWNLMGCCLWGHTESDTTEAT